MLIFAVNNKSFYEIPYSQGESMEQAATVMSTDDAIPLEIIAGDGTNKEKGSDEVIMLPHERAQRKLSNRDFESLMKEAVNSLFPAPVIFTEMKYGALLDQLAQFLVKQLQTTERAKSIILEGYERIKKADKFGEKTVCVMELKESTDYIRRELAKENAPVSPFVLPTDWLIGPGQLVFDYFRTQGFNPSIRRYPHAIDVNWTSLELSELKGVE